MVSSRGRPGLISGQFVSMNLVLADGNQCEIDVDLNLCRM